MANKLYEENDIQDIADAIRSKNGSSDTYKVSEMASAISNIPSGGGGTPVSVASKGVDFIDYDGTILYSYTIEEAQALTALPDLPSHDGLICQGWNWTLADIKALGREVIVGAMYITDDGKTRLYIHIATDGRMTVPLCFRQTVANGVEVDWGDGSATETFSGKGTTNIFPTHTYSAIGDYVISLNVTSGTLTLGSTSTTYCIMGSTNNANNVYRNMLYKVEIGSSVTSISNRAFYSCYSLSKVAIPNSVTSIDTFAFSNCYSLSKVAIPNSVTSIGNTAFNNCYSLSKVAIPNSITSIGSTVFSNCYSLSRVAIPNSITSIATSIFSNCYSLSKVAIPSSVTSISNAAFSYCYGVAEYNFSNHTSVPTLANTSAFNSIASDCYIIVPESLYAEWIAATNWSTYADYIIPYIDIPI